ncbi:unnamed protein product [Diamesa tonsa]
MKCLIVLFAVVVATLAAPQGEPKPHHTIDFNRFWTQEEIDNYITKLNNEYPQFIEVEVIGKTSESREIRAIRVTNEDTLTDDTPAIFITAGLNARDWMATMSAIDIIHELVEHNYAFENFLDNLVWYILPVANPDGYIFSHGAGQRMWRKTRSFTGYWNNWWYLQCIGTDGNRNFDFHWGEIGASSKCSADTYRGTKAFSEMETQALRDVVESLKENCKFYLTLHSFGQYLLYPWGYTSELPETWKDLHEVAEAGADAIYKTTGTKYTVGSSTNVLYAAAGGSDDWAFAVTDVPISFVMELPGGGNFGFDLPARDIDKTVKESAVGIFAMIERVNDKYPN